MRLVLKRIQLDYSIVYAMKMCEYHEFTYQSLLSYKKRFTSGAAVSFEPILSYCKCL